METAEELTAEDRFFSKFDPLDYLCGRAAEDRIQVFAVVDAFAAAGDSYAPGDADSCRRCADVVAEVAKKYQVGGVLLDGLDRPVDEETLYAAITQVAQETEKYARGAILGILFDGAASQGVSPGLVTRLTESGSVDMVVPRIAAAVDDPEQGYQKLLLRWLDALRGEAKLYTGNAVYMLTRGGADGAAYQDKEELSYQLFLNSVTQGVSGAVLESYRDLRGSRADTEMLVSFLSSGGAVNPLEGIDLSYPQTLKVTYPDAEPFRTTTSNIFIMGTSDPGQELTMNGEPVERQSFGGTFGVKADLTEGTNTYVFRQGDRSQTVTVVRYTPSTTPVPITSLTKSSIFPQVPHGVDANETITLSCVGPSGGKVTAALGGQTVTLTQAAASAQGTPVRFEGDITLSPGNYPAERTTNIGKVTYVLTYNGVNSTFTSAGDTLVAGSGVQLQVRLTAQLANVLKDPDDDDSVYATLREHAVVKVAGKERTTREGVGTIAYKLEDGGYVMGNNLEVVEGDPVPRAQVSSIETQLLETGETLYLTGDTPGATVTQEEGRLVVDFFDTDVTTDPDLFTSAFFDRMSVETTAYGSRMTLRLREGASTWGYNVEYTENGLQLYIKKPPVRSATYGKPLEGVTVMLDPGHGGNDPGALGITYGTGPDEADLNLAVSLAAKYRLEQLGAQVTMTRVDDLTEDSRLTVTERNIMADGAKPDVFISIHHNSANLVGNLNNANWMECYYFEAQSEPLAKTLLDRLGPMLNREVQGPAWGRYYVTRLTFAPAVLLETGYMVNPTNYEEGSNTLTIFKTACGIARSVLDMIPEAPQHIASPEESGT